MERRAFLSLGPAAALAPLAVVRADAGTQPIRMTLGCQSGPANDEHFAYFARYGVRNASAQAAVTNGRVYATLAELQALRALGERHGVAVDLLDPPFLKAHHIDRQAHPAIMLADSPERDRDIERFQTLIRNCARAGIPGIKYNMSLLGVLRTGDVPGRGDSRYLQWKLADARPGAPLTRAGHVDADRFWERITYFLEQVVPVAEEYKIRLACHPQDPGTAPGGYQGIDNVLGTTEGLKRFVGIRPSRWHGLNLCLGTVAENRVPSDGSMAEIVRWFGTRGKIFNVHFRNVRGRRDDFLEVFPDEGDSNMPAMLDALIDVGYAGMLMPDHVPEVPGQPQAQLASFAFCYGYIRGLLQSAAHARGLRLNQAGSA